MLRVALLALLLGDTPDSRALALELEAARSERIYLVVDVPEARLSLHLGGVSLKHYPLESLASGRRLFARAPEDVLLRLSECRPLFARELPVIRPGATVVDEAAPGKARPRRLLIDCGDELSLILTDDARSLRDGLRRSGEPGASVRVRAVLAAEAVMKLESALPESFLLLFVLR